MRRTVAWLAVVGAAAAITLPSTAPAAAAPIRLRLTSPAFAPNALIPSGFTCDGPDVPPPLRWSGVPAHTAELALTVDDPDAPQGTYVHWVAWRIDPTVGGLPEGVVPAGVQQGRNSSGHDGYFGPCPPAGSAPHHYRFTLYALRRPLALASGATLGALRTAIARTVLARALLVGRYER